MLQGEHSAVLSTFIMPPFVINIFLCLFWSGRLRQVLPYLTDITSRANGISLLFMPPNLEKLKGHIAFGLSISPSFRPSVHPLKIY